MVHFTTWYMYPCLYPFNFVLHKIITFHIKWMHKIDKIQYILMAKQHSFVLAMSWRGEGLKTSDLCVYKATKNPRLYRWPGRTDNSDNSFLRSAIESLQIWTAAQQNLQNDPCVQRRLRSAWVDQPKHPATLIRDQWVTKGPMFLHSDSVDWSDWAEGWSESSLGAVVILLVLSCGGSYRSFQVR